MQLVLQLGHAAYAYMLVSLGCTAGSAWWSAVSVVVCCMHRHHYARTIAKAAKLLLVITWYIRFSMAKSNVCYNIINGRSYHIISLCQGPAYAYVDDVNSVKAQLEDMVPSLQAVIADITHVMRRFRETLTPHHPAIGEHDSLLACHHCRSPAYPFGYL